MNEKVIDRIRAFSDRYGKDLVIGGTPWRYYRLGMGPPILWLTGGLRRAAFGFAFLECLGQRRTVIAPDYPPVGSFQDLLSGFEAILAAAGADRFALGGQSYGGLLAQALLATRPDRVTHLLLSSTGPADYGRAWAAVDDLCILLARLLPERPLKRLLAGGLLRIVSFPPDERAAWEAALRQVMDHDLTRGDVISHFAVVADIIRQGLIRPGVFASWPGRVAVLSAEDDPTQGKGDRRRYERLFGRPVEIVSLGAIGHTGALRDPARFVAVLEQTLADD
jgi:pimeloyl-ACP methyl ester carboxylesterase